MGRRWGGWGPREATTTDPSAHLSGTVPTTTNVANRLATLFALSSRSAAAGSETLLLLTLEKLRKIVLSVNTCQKRFLRLHVFEEKSL